MTTLTLDLDQLGDQCLIDIANALSCDVEDAAYQAAHSLEQRDYNKLMADLNKSFHEICFEIIKRHIRQGDEFQISDHVRAPRLDQHLGPIEEGSAGEFDRYIAGDR